MIHDKMGTQVFMLKMKGLGQVSSFFLRSFTNNAQMIHTELMNELHPRVDNFRMFKKKLDQLLMVQLISHSLSKYTENVGGKLILLTEINLDRSIRNPSNSPNVDFPDLSSTANVTLDLK